VADAGPRPSRYRRLLTRDGLPRIAGPAYPTPAIVSDGTSSTLVLDVGPAYPGVVAQLAMLLAMLSPLLILPVEWAFAVCFLGGWMTWMHRRTTPRRHRVRLRAHRAGVEVSSVVGHRRSTLDEVVAERTIADARTFGWEDLPRVRIEDGALVLGDARYPIGRHRVSAAAWVDEVARRRAALVGEDRSSARRALGALLENP
jgi:hypothetical protein